MVRRITAPAFSLAPQPQGQGLNLGGAPNPYQMARVPYGQDPFITTAALAAFGGRNFNEAMQNVAQVAPAGLAAKTAMQRDMYSIQEKNAEQARLNAAMNAAIKIKSNQPLTAADQAALNAAPEVMLKFGMPEKPEYMAVDGRVFNETTGEFVDTGGGGRPPPKTTEVLQFRRDQTGQESYKHLAATKGAYESMVRSAAVKGGGADLDIIYGIAKILDPIGAVREGDTVLIQNTAGVPQWVLGQIAGFNNGQELTAETRNRLMQMATQRMQAMEKKFEYDRQQNQSFAERMGFDPEDVLDLEDIPAFDPNLTTGGTATVSPPPRPAD